LRELPKSRPRDVASEFESEHLVEGELMSVDDEAPREGQTGAERSETLKARVDKMLQMRENRAHL
jgi:hypothetical protein